MECEGINNHLQHDVQSIISRSYCSTSRHRHVRLLSRSNSDRHGQNSSRYGQYVVKICGLQCCTLAGRAVDSPGPHGLWPVAGNCSLPKGCATTTMLGRRVQHKGDPTMRELRRAWLCLIVIGLVILLSGQAVSATPI